MNDDLGAISLSQTDIPAIAMVGVAVVVGYYAGRFAQRMRLPSIIGYMAVGVLLGPSIIGVFDRHTLQGLAFITEVALGFVAFSIGTELNFASIKRQGSGIISIILSESFGAFLFVFAGVYVFTRDLPLSLIFASMAPASAPAGTVAVIQGCKAKGKLTQALYAVVAFDDGLAIVIFAFAVAIARSLLISEATGTAGAVLPALWVPIKEIVLSLVLGGVAGFLFCQLVRRLQSSREIFILLFGFVLIVTGLAAHWHLSLILANMTIGCVLANIRREAAVRRIVAPLLDIMPLVFILFFCLAGTHLDLAALTSLGVLGTVYIVGRTGGKIIGARMGGMVGGIDAKVKKYIGLGILSQAGVAIGVALIVKHEFGILANEYNIEHAAVIGAATLTTVTATSIFFEIVGPICAKIALAKAGEIPKAE
ncbi:MAG: hypothetical protein GWP08_14940 [Nitrospiraceae bacterium]|nr:hypothetical protein [Nitrospiraceae bacterium]